MIVGGPQRRVEQFHRISSGARQRVVKPVGAAGTGSGNLVVPREVAECRLRGAVRWLDSTPERPRVRVAVAVPDKYAVLEAVMNLGRIVRGLAAAASVVVLSLSLSACSSGGPSAPASQGGAGNGAAGEADGLVKEFLDKDLVLQDRYEELKDKPFRLNSDGTVTGPSETLLYMSKATNWRFQDGTLDLCTSQDCTHWSAWTVATGESPFSTGKAYVLTLANAEKDNGAPVTRTLIVAG